MWEKGEERVGEYVWERVCVRESGRNKSGDLRVTFQLWPNNLGTLGFCSFIHQQLLAFLYSSLFSSGDLPFACTSHQTKVEAG